jgi:hypothetical protein
MFAKSTNLNRVTAAFLALALALLGFGHQHVPAAPSDPLMAAHCHKSATLDEKDHDDDGPSHGMEPDCPVCTLAKAMYLSAQIEIIAVITLPPRVLWPLAVDLPVQRHTSLPPPARAPPAPLV